jgi:hypothetical protein
MPLYPLELHSSPQLLPLIHPPQNALNQVSILHCLSRTCPPPILPPILRPIRHTIDGVTGVCHNGNGTVTGTYIQGAENSGEFGALVGLAGAGKGFGYVSGEC